METEARIAILDVEDRIIEALFLGQLDVKLDIRIRASRQKEESKRVRARSLAPRRLVDFIHDLVHRDDVAGSLAHLHDLTALRDVHELVEERFEALLGQAERGQRIAHARDVPVVVRPENVDESIVTPRDLVGEIGYIRGEIRPTPVALLDNPVLVLDRPVRRMKEECAVFSHKVSPHFQSLHHGVDGSPTVKRFLAKPHVEVHSEIGERLGDARQGS